MGRRMDGHKKAPEPILVAKIREEKRKIHFNKQKINSFQRHTGHSAGTSSSNGGEARGG